MTTITLPQRVPAHSDDSVGPPERSAWPMTPRERALIRMPIQ